MPWEKQFNTDDVLHSAMQAFWVRGYEATSVQQLVDCTGINRASIYAQFNDKRQLFLASLVHYRDRVLGERLARLEKQSVPSAAVRELFEEFANSAVEAGGNRGCLVANTALELAAHDPQVREIVTGALCALEKFLLRMVELRARENGMEAHQECSGANRKTAKALLASLLGLLILLKSHPEQELLDDVIDDACNRLN